MLPERAREFSLKGAVAVVKINCCEGSMHFCLSRVVMILGIISCIVQYIIIGC